MLERKYAELTGGRGFTLREVGLIDSCQGGRSALSSLNSIRLTWAGFSSYLIAGVSFSAY